MDIRMKNPRDPKYREYHDGYDEYWPICSPSKTKSGSFPAALSNGLMLAVAAFASVAVYLAVLTLSVATVLVTVSSRYGVVHVTVRRSEGKMIRYVLTEASNSDQEIVSDILAGDGDTLRFDDLTPETEYLITYYTEEETPQKVGSFRFTTTAELTESTEPTEPPTEPTEPPTEPTEPPTEPTEPPTEPTEPPTEPTEPPTEPTEPPTEPTEPPTVPTEPPTRPTEPPTEPTEPPTEPTEPPTEPPTETLQPVAETPVLGDVAFITAESGELVDGYYSYVEYFTFTSIPEGAYEIQVLRDGGVAPEYEVDESADGSFTVAVFYGLVAIGSNSNTSVTVSWEDGTSVTSTNTVRPPALDSADLTVTKNADGTHTFNITLSVIPGSHGPISTEVELYTDWDTQGVRVALSAASASTYTGSYTAAVQSEYTDAVATVYISGVWSIAGRPSYYDEPPSVYADVEYLI